MRSLSLVLLVLLVLAGAPNVLAAQSGDQAPTGFRVSRDGARLVVLLVVDQLGSDILEGAWPHLGVGGFRRLASDGVTFASCAFDHACTETGPGHATISTGASPWIHGIPGNEWIDPDARPDPEHPGCVIETGCVADRSLKTVGGTPKTEPSGPRHLRAPTLGDAMKAAFGGGSRVISLSMKDRAAILMGGRSADAALWYDKGSGRFVTSTAWPDHGAESFLARINADLALAGGARIPKGLVRYLGWSWEPLASAPAGAFAGIDDAPKAEISASGLIDLEWPSKASGLRPAFPHVLDDCAGDPKRFFTQIYETPAGNEALLALAREAILNWRLGRDTTPDLLCVSLSSNDLVGHYFGANSREVRDVTLRTDLLLRDFMRFLDAEVGAGLWDLALTADHGISPSPEWCEAQGIAAGRIGFQEVIAAVDLALSTAFGDPDGESTLDARVGTAPASAGSAVRPASAQEGGPSERVAKPARSWVLQTYEKKTDEKRFAEPVLVFDRRVIEEKLRARRISSADEVAAVAARAAARIPGIAEAFTLHELREGRVPQDAIHEVIRRSFAPSFAGDVYLLPKPYWSFGRTYASSHGTPYSYDRRVPLFFVGPGFAGAKTVTAPCSPGSIAATLCASLGIGPPAASDHPAITEALSAQSN